MPVIKLDVRYSTINYRFSYSHLNVEKHMVYHIRFFQLFDDFIKLCFYVMHIFILPALLLSNMTIWIELIMLVRTCRCAALCDVCLDFSVLTQAIR
jgi:hypothetical protein